MSKRIAPLALALGMLLAASAEPVAAVEMQPGMWRFTQTTQAGGRAKSRGKARCVSVAQAKDPARYFTPIGQGCALVSHSTLGSRISSTMRCTNGAATTDVISTVSIDTPTHLTMSSTMTVSAGSTSTSATIRGEGRRTGNCRG